MLMVVDVFTGRKGEGLKAGIAIGIKEFAEKTKKRAEAQSLFSPFRIKARLITS
jgi:hypothetical protein